MKENVAPEIRRLREEIEKLRLLIVNPTPKRKVFKVRTAADVMAIPQAVIAGYEIEY